MGLPGIIRRNRTASRRWVAVLTLVALVLGTTGIPVPTWADKDTTVPFPCMHRSCGCKNAAACWNSCCCNTNAQKLAWAKKNAVQAPAFVVAAAKGERGKTSSTHVTKSCCSPSAKRRAPTAVVCHTKTPAKSAQKSCCSGPVVHQKQSTAPRDFVRLEDARRCQGQAELWLMLRQVLPPPPKIELDCTPIALDWLSLNSAATEILSSQPGQRPPQQVL
jgi:hypothetical protein